MLDITNVSALANAVKSAPMEPWRKRLKDAVDADERSYAKILEAAKLSRSFITEVLNDPDPNDPSLTNVMKLCDALGVSFLWVATGLKISREAQEYLTIFSNLPDGDRQTLLRLSRSMLSDAGIPEPGHERPSKAPPAPQPARRQTS
jgi:transcriptional regulator with XRE-family HTH domain